MDWQKKYEDQVIISDSLKRDLAHLQGHTIMPCPAADKMGEHACKNQHECWEPCGVLGNDERFVAVKPYDPAENDAVLAALGIPRQLHCDVTFRGVRVGTAPMPVPIDVIPADPDPAKLAVRPARRAEASVDDGHRRRKSD
jgi:hypothetical protein